MENEKNSSKQLMYGDYLLKSDRTEEEAKEEILTDEDDIRIMDQLLKRLCNTNLKEEELEEIIEGALTMKTDYKKGQILITIAKHQQTPPDLILEIRKFIFNKINDNHKRKTFLNEIDIHIEETIEQSLEKLDDKNLKEEELEKIAQIVSLIKDDFTKGEILVKVAKHPQASTGLIKEIMWLYYSGEIKDTIIIKENLNRLHIILDKKENKKANKIKAKQLEQCKEASEEFSTGPIFAVLNDDEYYGILDKKEEESKIKSQQTQQLKQCEGEFGNFSISKHNELTNLW